MDRRRAPDWLQAVDVGGAHACVGYKMWPMNVRHEEVPLGGPNNVTNGAWIGQQGRRAAQGRARPVAST